MCGVQGYGRGFSGGTSGGATTMFGISRHNGYRFRRVSEGIIGEFMELFS